ncbi:hypothetical protein Tco_1259067 [Tanacetum coccineum]
MFVNHMHQPWRTLSAIINKGLYGKIASNDKLRKSIIDILWGMFYRENVDYPELIWEDLAFQIDHMKEKRSRQDYHEYGLVIPEVMLNDTIKQSESYQMFIKYSTESEPKPEPVKRKIASRLVVKKKVIISADDNIISDNPDVALKLGKSISKIKAEEAEAAMQVHATHARIVNESVPELTRRRKLGKVTSDPPKKLKGVPSLTPEEQEAVDIMQALKESRKTSRRRPGTRGSNKGTGTIPRVTDESTVISATLSEGTESKYPKEDQLGDDEKDDKDDDADDEGNDYISDNQDDDDEDDKTESDEDEIISDAEVSDAAKVDAEKSEEAKDDSKKLELPPTISTVKDTTDAEINSLLEFHTSTRISLATVTTLPPPSVSITPPVPQQTTTPIPTPPITTDAPTITIVASESNALFVVQLRVAKLEKDVSELNKIDLSVEALAALKTQVPSVVDNYLGSKVGDVFQTELKKHTTYFIQKYSQQ